MTASRSTQTDTTLTIAVDKISKRYNREWIFRNLDRHFFSGSTYAITGPNGSGKSTLLQVLWGQVPQTSGTLRYVKGSDIAMDDIFRHIAIATPYMDLIDEFTLAETLDFHFSLKQLRSDLTRDELPGRMYLEHAMDKQLVNFSSGMKQRLKLALAFYTAADVYFFDEPGTNLDSRAFQWYRAELGALRSSALVMIASNDPEEYPNTAHIINLMDYK